MELGLTGKRVLITGASKGIGRAVAETLAEEGCSLHLASRTEADLATARDEINERHGVQVTIHPLDLSDSANVRQLVKDTEGIDILINNAGAIPGGDIEKVDEATWRAAWDLKVFGYINMCREVYPAMCARGHGVIFNIIGMAGLNPRANYIAGSVGNAGLNALTIGLGGESLDHGVRVLGIHPGPIETERLTTLYKAMAERELGDTSRYKEMYKGLPAGRPGTPEECATVTAMLISDKSYWVNGCVIPVNGKGAGW
ncbi:MAG: short-chain dehydrogenase/reductase [Rickettsiales bacterium]|jgi:NAD(P)-dependent dehydrogenase (short-subunit alcohol dehydrogenase family)